MDKAKPNCVMVTGAKAGDLLEGLDPKNAGMVVQIKADQRAGAQGKLTGSIKIVEAGGPHKAALTGLIDNTFRTAEAILGYVKKTDPKATNFLNSSSLAVKQRPQS